MKESAKKTQDDHNRKNLRVSITSLVLAAILGFGNFGYQIWRDQRSNRSNDVRFGKVETTIRLLTGILAPQMQKAVDDSLASALQEPDGSRDKLRTADTVLQQLTQSSISLPKDAILKTGGQLSDLAAVDKDAPELWQTAGVFISYRSQVHAKWEIVELPPCSDQPINVQVSEIRTYGSTAAVEHGPVRFESCKMTLDSAEGSALLSEGLAISHVIFDHCMIFYGGGPIVLAKLKIAQNSPAQFNGNIYFANCLFTVTLSKPPPPAGQRLTRELLMSTTDSVHLDIGDAQAM